MVGYLPTYLPLTEHVNRLNGLCSVYLKYEDEGKKEEGIHEDVGKKAGRTSTKRSETRKNKKGSSEDDRKKERRRKLVKMKGRRREKK